MFVLCNACLLNLCVKLCLDITFLNMAPRLISGIDFLLCTLLNFMLLKESKMSSFEHTASVSGQESSSGESVGFEELVEWKGPVVSAGGLGASMLYTMDGEEFFFSLMDEDEVSSEMAYRRPRDEYAPDKREPKVWSCEEKDEPKVLQYKTTVSKLRRLDGIREHYHFSILYKTYCLEATQQIHTPPENCMTTYVVHLRAGLQFLLHPLFVDICKYYRI